MRFNRNVSLLVMFLALLLIGVGLTSATNLPYYSDDVKGKNDTGCVEVLEAKRGAEQCKSEGSLLVRCKVNCVKPVDVRIGIKTNKGWRFANYTNKNTGDELTAYECRSNGQYVILKREAGSNAEWPNP